MCYMLLMWFILLFTHTRYLFLIVPGFILYKGVRMLLNYVFTPDAEGPGTCSMLPTLCTLTVLHFRVSLW